MSIPFEFFEYEQSIHPELDSEHPSPKNQPKVRVYGGHAAAVFEATLHSTGKPTLNIEVAPKRESSFVWDLKLVFQLTPTELPSFAAVVLGYTPHLNIKREAKGIEFKRQPQGLFVSASQPGARYALPVSAGDLFWVADLAMARLKSASVSKDSSVLVACLNGTISPH